MKQRSPNKQDVEIGKRIRGVRMAANISQAELGDVLGVSFQQIQKYEKGINRVSATRLQQVANALSVPLADLLGTDTSAPGDKLRDDFFFVQHAAELARAFLSLSQKQRVAVRDVALAFGECA